MRYIIEEAAKALRAPSDLRIVGTKVNEPIHLPNRLGGSADGPGFAGLFPGQKVYYHSIGQSGGGRHGLMFSPELQ